MPNEGHSRPPARRAGGRHRKKSTFPTGHLATTVLAAGVVVAAGPLLSAPAASQPDSAVRDVLRMAFTTEATVDELRAFPTLIPTRAPAVNPLTEVQQLDRADQVRERQRKALAAEQARVAEEKRRKAEAESARKEAAREAAERKEAAERQAAKATGWVKPTVGRFTSGFGARWGSTHYGVDIANSIGTPILAAASGTVIDSGPANGFGLWVRIQHNDGTVTVYGHINEALVSTGTRVTAGQQIATMGNRGQSTGPHLHFEVWVDGSRKVNPVSWMAARGAPLV